MDRVLISWNVPNVITIWLMLFLGFLFLSVVAQLVTKKSSGTANNAAGY